MEEMLRKTKILLKSYQMAKFAVMVRTQEVEDELFDSDMKSIENLIDSVLGEDLMLNGKYLENKLVEVRATATLPHRMELCLQWLRKYPGKVRYIMTCYISFTFRGSIMDTRWLRKCLICQEPLTIDILRKQKLHILNYYGLIILQRGVKHK